MDNPNFYFKDNLVTLHIMLTSPHVADLKPVVETWITNLQEVENITDIWADCQKKVLAKKRKGVLSGLFNVSDVTNEVRVVYKGCGFKFSSLPLDGIVFQLVVLNSVTPPRFVPH